MSTTKKIAIIQRFITGANNLNRKKKGQKGVVMHWTANFGRGSGAKGHYGYVSRKGFKAPNGKLYEDAKFTRPFVYGAAEFYVDDKEIYQYIHKDNMAPHAGVTFANMTPIAKKLIGNDNPNLWLMGIEICVNIDSDLHQAIENACWLAAKLLKDEGNTPEDLYRHFDMSGKDCPAFAITPQIWKNKRGSHPFEFREWETIRKQVEFYFYTGSDPVQISAKRNSVLPNLDDELRVRILQYKSTFINLETGRWDTQEQKEISALANKIRQERGWDGPTKPSVVPSKPKQPEQEAFKIPSTKEIQQRLNILGMRDDLNKMLAEDGGFGPKTKFAISRFQNVMGIKEDGVWNETCESIFEDIVKKPKLSKGSKGYVVRFVQQKLGGPINGDFGNLTHTAAIRYQSAKDILPIDGVVGSRTWDTFLNITETKETPIQTDLKVLLNGFDMVFKFGKPYIEDGVTMVPVMDIYENLKIKTEWVGEKSEVQAVVQGKTFNVNVKNGLMYGTLLNRQVTMIPSPVLKEGIGGTRTFVPLAAFFKVLGYDVKWDGEKRQVIITG